MFDDFDSIAKSNPSLTIGEIHDAYETQLKFVAAHTDLAKRPKFLSKRCFVYTNNSDDIFSSDRTSEFEITSLLTFIQDRLKVYLRDKGIRHDIIDAGLTEGQDDLVSIVNRVTALQSFLETDDGENLLAGYKRAANILKAEAKKGELPKGDANRPKDEHGAALFDALKTAKPKILAAVGQEDYAESLTSLANLRIPIDAIFTHSQIITEDKAVRENNLRLLAMISDTSRQIADFEAIQS